jgi:hypothetical protein
VVTCKQSARACWVVAAALWVAATAMLCFCLLSVLGGIIKVKCTLSCHVWTCRYHQCSWAVLWSCLGEPAEALQPQNIDYPPDCCTVQQVSMP